MAQGTMIFPPDFRWGTATASFQVEGHTTNSDWWTWEQEPGRILHNQRSGQACNWWEDAEADLDRAAALGNNAHRLSVEWSRIEPEPSVFDKEALNRYREILQAMIARGLEPMVTLHHFSNPLWLAEKGDFTSGLVVDYFRRYVAQVVAALGDLVSKWITINEPMVYVYMRHMRGVYPATATGYGTAFRVIRNLLRSHAAAYHAIKEGQPAAQVGIAKYVPVMQNRPGSNFLSTPWRRWLHYLFNDLWLNGMVSGRFAFPLGRQSIPHLKNSFDFLGVNYYSRWYISFPRLVTQDWGPDAVVSDGDFSEVYPAGMFSAIKWANRFNKPIYITENGLPDHDDDLRPGFILTHLREVWRAVSFCFPVMGYYHWTLVDNFEWDRGWTQRFGLYGLDETTGARFERPSARLYKEICQSRSVTSQMVQQYAPHLMPALFPD